MDRFPSADGDSIEEELGEQTVGMALQMLRFKIVVMLRLDVGATEVRNADRDLMQAKLVLPPLPLFISAVGTGY
ncbi:Ubiquitin carboxyl-terminal hydrolase family protein, partial [Prunus dulcis]